VSNQFRREAILECLERQDSLSYREIAERFHTSSKTARRDVEELCRRGSVIKINGGVRRAERSSTLFETPLASRLMIQRAEKRALAECALRLIAPGQTVYLDGGTSCVELARCLADRAAHVTFISNSALICLELGRSSQNTIISIGGQYCADNFCFIGPIAEDIAHRFYVDIAIFSTKGFIPREGTYESFEPMFRIKQIFAGQCRQAVVLADHTKFGQRALCKVLGISQIHTVITDALTPIEHRDALLQAGRQVFTAPLEVPHHRSNSSSIGDIDHAA
jgi:DeoR family fructose operon transcriptional repressor